MHFVVLRLFLAERACNVDSNEMHMCTKHRCTFVDMDVVFVSSPCVRACFPWPRDGDHDEEVHHGRGSLAEVPLR